VLEVVCFHSYFLIITFVAGNFLVCDLQANDWHCRNNHGLNEVEDAHKESSFNRGEEMWHSTREAWLERTHSSVPLSKPLSQKGTQALVQFMKEKEGAHPLPRRIPLSSMVQIYHQHVWEDFEETCDVCEKAQRRQV
jgi:hypothetical protein